MKDSDPFFVRSNDQEVIRSGESLSTSAKLARDVRISHSHTIHEAGSSPSLPY